MFQEASLPSQLFGVAPPTGGYEASDRKRSSETIDFYNSLIIYNASAQRIQTKPSDEPNIFTIFATVRRDSAAYNT